MELPICMRNNSLDDALTLKYNPALVAKIKADNEKGYQNYLSAKANYLTWCYYTTDGFYEMWGKLVKLFILYKCKYISYSNGIGEGERWYYEGLNEKSPADKKQYSYRYDN